MQKVRNLLRALGFNHYSSYVKASFVRQNVRAIKVISIMCLCTAVLFLIFSFTYSDFSSLIYRLNSIITALFSIASLFLIHFHYYNENEFHHFHAWVLIYVTVLAVFSIIASITDSMHGGGFLVFLTVQMWIFNLMLIPPFVSVILCGIYFTVFLTAVYCFVPSQPIKYFESIFSYLTIMIINYIHYSVMLRQAVQQEEILHKNEYLSAVSTTDSLTNVRNRAGLRMDFSSYVSEHLYVMMADIDDFKKFNDAYGHQTGDLILKNYAACLSHVFGPEDVYRFGGDEFLVIKVMNSPEEFEDCLLHARWMTHNMEPGISIKPTSSCGYVYGICHSEEDLRTMINEADKLLYHAKKKGKNQTESTPYGSQERKE